MNLLARAAESAKFVLLGKVVTPVVTFSATALIIRWLSIEAFATYALLYSTLDYVRLFSAGGLQTAVSRFVPEISRERRRCDRLGMTLLALTTLTPIVMTLLAIPLMPRLRSFMGTTSAEFLIFIPLAVTNVQSLIAEAFLAGLFLHKGNAAASIVRSVLRGVIALSLIALGFGLVGLLLADTAANAAALLVQTAVYVSARRRGREEKPAASKPIAKRFTRFTLFSTLSGLGQAVLDYGTDLLIMRGFGLPVHLIAKYALAALQTSAVFRLLPHRMFLSVLIPYTVSTHLAGPGKLLKTCRTLFTVIWATSLPLLPLAALLAPAGLTLVFGDKFAGAEWLFVVVVGFGVLNALQTPVGLAVLSLEKPQYNLMSRVASLYNLVLDIALVKPFGVWGIVFATGSAVLLKWLIMLVLVRRHVRLGVPLVPFAKVAANVAAATLVASFVPRTGALGLVAAAVVFTTCYYVASRVNCPLDEEERDALSRLVGVRLL